MIEITKKGTILILFSLIFFRILVFRGVVKIDIQYMVFLGKYKQAGCPVARFFLYRDSGRRNI